jgi:release factor glutamine methyltransferase
MSDGTIAWAELLVQAEQRLAQAAVAGLNPRVEASWLVEEASGFDAAELVSRRLEKATKRSVAHFDSMLARREQGEPIQYVLGHWPFRYLDLVVDRRVLIPRPETELLAGLVIDLLPGPPQRPIVADLGTGSGAIGLSVLAEHPTALVWLTDIDPDALSVAGANLAGLGSAATRGRVSCGRWFGALDDELVGSFDVVVSNPPYVATTDEVDVSVTKWEPHRALFAGPSGLDDLAELIAAAPRWLAPSGRLLLEHGPEHGPATRLAAQAAGFATVRTHRDHAGHDRVLDACWPE